MAIANIVSESLVDGPLIVNGQRTVSSITNSEFQTDGTNDEVQINQAMVDASTGTTRKTVVLTGEFSTGATVIWKQGVQLISENALITPTGDFDCIQNEDQSNTTKNYTMEGTLIIDGTNVTSATNQLFSFTNVTDFILNGQLFAKNGGARAFHFQNCKQGMVNMLHGQDTHDVLFVISGTGGITFTNVYARGSASDGGQIRSCEGVQILNMTSELNQRHGFLFSSSHNCFVKGIFRNNNQENVAEFNGFSVNQVSGGSIPTRNRFDLICEDDQGSPTQTHGIKIVDPGTLNEYNVQGLGNVIALVEDTGTENIQLNRFGLAASTISANDLTVSLGFNIFPITGNTQINGISTVGHWTGERITLKYSGTPTISDDGGSGAGFADIKTNTGANITVSAGDFHVYEFDGTNWLHVGGMLS